MTDSANSSAADARRFIPRTDALLALPQAQDLAPHVARQVISQVQEQARQGIIAPGEVEAEVIRQLEAQESFSLLPVINATGVIVHTNLGRAPLGKDAIKALVAAAGYTDVELDMGSGQRASTRGAQATQALLRACPAAEDALVVNNGAAALLLACAALAEHKEVIISRGELIEIGAGFRLPELIESAHVRLREVGATNRTHLADYERAIGEATGAIVKVHPSNFRIEGFTSAVEVPQLQQLARQKGVSLIVDLGSGLLQADAALPQEPNLQDQLTAGADVVIASGDKLLGGPQAGIILGRKEAIAKLKEHPLARALRIDKLRLNALEASINTRTNAVEAALHINPEELQRRSQDLAHKCGGEVVEHAGRVGGGGAPEFPLPGWAVRLPECVAAGLREQRILARVHGGACLIDLRCVPASEDARLAQAVLEVIKPAGSRHKGK